MLFCEYLDFGIYLICADGLPIRDLSLACCFSCLSGDQAAQENNVGEAMRRLGEAYIQQRSLREAGQGKSVKLNSLN